MNLPARMNEIMDLEFAKKAFLVLSAAALAWIPLGGIWIYSQGPKPVALESSAPDRGLTELEPEESYLMAFNGSAHFGASGAASPALQASMTELVKDYRLKGVVLAGVSEAIVEDARTQKTIFVKTGDQLGELTVKEVGEGFVVLSYLGQEIKLGIQ